MKEDIIIAKKGMASLDLEVQFVKTDYGQYYKAIISSCIIINGQHNYIIASAYARKESKAISFALRDLSDKLIQENQ
jgi:hypothetical protein